MTLTFPGKKKGRILAPSPAELLCNANTWLCLSCSLQVQRSFVLPSTSGSCCDGWTQQLKLKVLNTEVLKGWPGDTGILSTFWPRIRRTLLELRKQVSVNCCLRADIIWHIWINMYVKQNTKALEQRTGERYYGRAWKSHGWQDISSTHKRNLLSFSWTLDTGREFAKDRHLSGTGRIYGKNWSFLILEN